MPNKITEQTKKAWKENWQDHNIEEVLEIFEYTRVKRILNIFKSILPRKGKILEGGCGLGPWLIKLRSLGYDMMGVDYDPVSVDKIKTYNKDIPVEVSNIENMPFDNEYFDAYISLGVNEHFCDGPQSAIKEAWRVLKKDGIFLVTVPYMNMLLRMKYPFEKLKKNRIARKLFGKEEKAFYYEKFFKIKEISDLLEDGGFEIDKVVPIDHIFSFVSFSGIFRDKNTYDGENELAVKVSDFLSKIFPWQTAASSLIVAKKIK